MFRPRNPDRPHEGDEDFAAIAAQGFRVRLTAYHGERCIRATALDKDGVSFDSARGFSVPGALAALRKRLATRKRDDAAMARAKALAKAEASAP